MKSQIANSRASLGFSLIEVMIAVLVLATGMLALAALQSALVRNSVDAKNRSQALSYAISKLERMREDVSGTIESYDGLDVGQSPWLSMDTRLVVNPAASGDDAQQFETGFGAGAYSPRDRDPQARSTSIEWRRNVTRFVRESNQAICGGAASTPCFRQAVAADSAQSGVAEFKRIDIEVRWTDAQGNVRTVTTSDVVGSVTDDKTDLILDQSGKPSTGVGAPVARIDRPSEAGIIPIAFGNNQETAASNPKPVTGRERGRTDETQFQVYTYSLDGNTATLSRVVDTRVLGCRCSLKSASAIVDATTVVGTPVQPTYWNGKEYIEPEAVANINEGLRGIGKLGAAQNEQLCTTCCLDHHDRASNAVKLDALRTHEAIHEHYYDPNEGNGIVEFTKARENDDYFESCRFVRVNGIFRVATDMRLEKMNLLETDPAYPDDSVPLQRVADEYAEAVKDFVDQRIVAGVPDPVLNYPNVFDPAPFQFRASDRQYQHNRGLYIDHLEQPALDALAEARAKCTDSDIINCLLPYVPVLALNTTELAQWTTTIDPGVGDVVSITNYSLSPVCRRPPCLVEDQVAARGVLTAVMNGAEDSIASQYRSNSGVADTYPIDHQDAGADLLDDNGQVLMSFPNQRERDSRDVTVSSGAGNQSAFTVTVSSSSTDFTPSIDIHWTDPSSVAGDACEGATTGGPNPYTCGLGSIQLPVPINLTVSRYNRDTGRTAQITNTCKSGKIKVPICANFAVSGVTINGSNSPPINVSNVSNDGKLAEYTVLSLPKQLLDPNASVNVVFGTPTLFNAPLTCAGTVATAACP